jgi:hypothetical protein
LVQGDPVSLANKFAAILCRQLNKIVPAGSWSCGKRIGSSREAVDVCGKLAGRPIYIEVELRRDEPLTNVVKLWRVIGDENHTPKVTLVQAFSGHYPAGNTHRLNAEFIGGRLQDSCEANYVPLYFPYRPRKGARVVGDYRRRAAKSLASTIRNALEKT